MRLSFPSRLSKILVAKNDAYGRRIESLAEIKEQTLRNSTNPVGYEHAMLPISVAIAFLIIAWRLHFE